MRISAVSGRVGGHDALEARVMNERAGRTGHDTLRVPVLIVGGSLVGLSMSVFLGRLGVRHMLVERHSGTSIHPRGRGNNVRTMELFRVAGVEPDIKAAASLLAENHGIQIGRASCRERA